MIFNVIARYIVGVAEGPYGIAAEGPSDESAIVAVAAVKVNVSVQLVRVEDCNGRVKDPRNFTVTTSSKIFTVATSSKIA